MDNGVQITMIRGEDHTYSWKPQRKAPRLLAIVMGLALLVALASLAIGAIVVSTLVATVLVITAAIRAPLRNWLGRRRGAVRRI